jgi:hypothetical protein
MATLTFGMNAREPSATTRLRRNEYKGIRPLRELLSSKLAPKIPLKRVSNVDSRRLVPEYLTLFYIGSNV